MNSKVILEKAACEVAKQSSVPPLIFRLPVEKGRQILENFLKPEAGGQKTEE